MKNLCYIKEALFLNFFFTIDCMNTKFFATRTFETFFVKKLIAQIVYHAAIKIVKKKKPLNVQLQPINRNVFAHSVKIC